MKLNIGCNKRRLEEYCNIDIREEVKPDKVIDVTKGFPFEDNSIEEIRAEHFLEHLFYLQAEPFLKECYRVLKAGGELVIEVPDFLKTCKILCYLSNPGDKRTLRYCLYGIYGGYADTKINIPQMHKWAWTGQTLKEILEKVGFEIIEISEGKFHFCIRDTFVRAKKK